MTGEELKRYRQRAKLTQQRLGEMLGYEGRNAELMVQHWEHDRLNVPVKVIKPLAKILNIPTEELLP